MILKDRQQKDKQFWALPGSKKLVALGPQTQLAKTTKKEVIERAGYRTGLRDGYSQRPDSGNHPSQR